MLWPTIILSHLAGVGGDGWTVDYIQYTEGPRTTVQGVARQYFKQDTTSVCLDYTFDIPEGHLAGGVISSQPGQPMLPFEYERHADGVQIQWCNEVSSLQTLPCQVPRFFQFYVIQTEYDPDDLAKPMSEWRNAERVWERNLDGAVHGDAHSTAHEGWEAQAGTGDREEQSERSHAGYVC